MASGTWIILFFSRGFCTSQVWLGAYWYQGVFLTQRSVNPASVRILIEAASASLTVSFTDCMRFCALWTSISVACQERRALHYSSPWCNPVSKIGLNQERSAAISCTCSHHWWIICITKKDPKLDHCDLVLCPQMAYSLYSLDLQVIPPSRLLIFIPSTWNNLPLGKHWFSFRSFCSTVTMVRPSFLILF